MEVSVGVLLGIMSLGSWGVSDYLARLYASQAGSNRTAFYVNVISLAPLLLVLATQAYLGQFPSHIDWPMVWKLGTLLGAVIAAAWILYYHGLEVGTVSIVAAVASGWFAVATILAFVFLGEVLSIYQVLLIGIITSGITMLSGLKFSSPNNRTGFTYGLASMILLGIATLLLKYLAEAAGPILTLVVCNSVAVVLIGLWNYRSNANLNLPGKKGLYVLIAAGLLNVVGLLCMVVGITLAPIFIVAPISAAHAIVTASLAWRFLHERLTVFQWVGFALTLGGVIGLGAYQ